MKYIGDISKQDVMVLANCAQQAHKILEFGVGASTQILCQHKPSLAQLIAIDTNPFWIQRTQSILSELPLNPYTHTFFLYEEWLQKSDELVKDSGLFDFVFIDLANEYRLEAANTAWKYLKIHGIMAFHDTRRYMDMKNVLTLVEKHFLEISQLELNKNSSNITLVHKKIHEPYLDWNVVENRSKWQSGAIAPPEDWIHQLD